MSSVVSKQIKAGKQIISRSKNKINYLGSVCVFACECVYVYVYAYAKVRATGPNY